MHINKIYKFSVVILIMLVSVIFCSCSCSCAGAEEEVATRSLQISEESKNVVVGSTFNIQYTVAPVNAKVQGVFINISNTEVVRTNTTTFNAYTYDVSFTAVAEGSATITFKTQDNGFEKSCTVNVYQTTTLRTPINVFFDGTKVIWDEVNKDILGEERECAEKYEVSISDSRDYSLGNFIVTDNYFAGTQQFSFEEGSTYIVSVKTIGDGIKNNDSADYSSNIKFTKLLKPLDVVVNDGLLSWTTNRNASHYAVVYKVGNEWDYSIIERSNGFITEYDLKQRLPEINNFEVKVISLKGTISGYNADEVFNNNIREGNLGVYCFTDIDTNIKYYSSEFSSTVNAIRLNKTADFSITNSNTKTEQIIEGVNVNMYDSTVLNFVGADEMYKDFVSYKIVVANASNISKKTTFDITDTQIELTEEMLRPLCDDVALNTFTITVQTLPKDNTYYSQFISGEISDTYTFKYYKFLPIHLNASISNGVLNYTLFNLSEVLVYDEYEFIFVDEENKTSVAHTTNQNNINLTEILGVSGTYDIYFINKGEVLSTSNLGTLNYIVPQKLSISFSCVDAPEILGITNSGEVSWSKVENSSNYIVELSDGLVTYYYEAEDDVESENLSVNVREILEQPHYNLTYKDLSVEVEYSIKVTALANSENYVNSVSEAITFSKLSAPENLSYNNSAVSWRNHASATGYNLWINSGAKTLYGKGVLIENDIFSKSAISNEIIEGINNFYLEALGNPEMNTINSDAGKVEVEKLLAPTDFLLSNGILNWDSELDGYNYNIRIYTTSNTIVDSIDSSENSQYNFSNITSTEVLYLKVQRIKSGYFNSNYSTAFYFKKLDKPVVNVINYNGTNIIYWQDVNSDLTEGYTIAIENMNSNTVIVVDEPQFINNVWQIDIPNLVAGNYKVTVKAVIEGVFNGETSAQVSAASSSDESEFELMKLSSAEFTLSNNNTKLVWDSVGEDCTGYSFEIKNSIDSSTIFNTNYGTSVEGYVCGDLVAGQYDFSIIALGNVEEIDSMTGVINQQPRFVLNSEITNITIKKLQPVTISSSNGKLCWERTVEGIPSTEGVADLYQLYANGERVNASDYTLETVGNNIEVSFNTNINSETNYSVITYREGLISSNISGSVRARNVAIEGLVKNGTTISFNAAYLDESSDLMSKYVLTWFRNGESLGTDWDFEIIANDENYFNNGTYSFEITDDNFSSGGIYVLNVSAVGQVVETSAGVITYLSNTIGKDLTVVKLNSATQDTVFVEDNILNVSKYEKTDPRVTLDAPKEIIITIYKQVLEEWQLFDTIIRNSSSSYNGSAFDLSEYVENNLSAGTYYTNVEFVGDGNNYIINSEVVNTSVFVKLDSPKVYILNGKLYWTNILNTITYYVYVDNVKIDNISNEFNTSQFAAGAHSIQVRATNPQCVWSNKSTLFTADQLANPTTFKTALSDQNKSMLQWYSVENATGYDVYCDDAEETALHGTLNMANNMFNLVIDSNKQAGIYNYYIMSMGSVDTRIGENYANSGYLNSNNSFNGSNTKTVSITIIEPTVEISLNNGNVTWLAVTGANEYKVMVYNYSGYPETKTLVNSTTISASFQSYDLELFNLTNGNYVIEVEVIANGLTHIVSTAEIDHYYLLVANQTEVDSNSVYSEFRVEDGCFAYDITLDYLNAYITNMNTMIGGNAYNLITLNTVESVYKKLASPEIIQQLYHLVNFKMSVNGVVLDACYPTDYNLDIENERITFYIELKNYNAGLYLVKIKPIGNTSSTNVIGIIDGGFTNSISGTIVSAPTCPILPETPINNGILSWLAVTNSTDVYYIWAENSTNSADKQRFEITLDAENQYESVVGHYAKDENAPTNGILNLDLNKYIEEELLVPGKSYKLSIAVKGTDDSRILEVGELIFLNGKVNNINTQFEVLVAPNIITVDNGDIYWSSNNSAIGYTLRFYKYNDLEYGVNPTVEEIVEKDNEVLNYTITLKDDERFTAGSYRVTIISNGNGLNILNSAPSEYLFVEKLNAISSMPLEQGVFTFDQVTYRELIEGIPSGAVNYATEYKIRVITTISSQEVLRSDWYNQDNCTLVNNKYYFELPDEYNGEYQYGLEIYALGDSERLLSSDSYISEKYFRSPVTTTFNMDEDGLITWVGDEDFYQVFVSTIGTNYQTLNFIINESDKNYTTNSRFNINDYYSNLNPAIYSVYVRSLHDNEFDDEIRIRSAKSDIFDLQIVNAPDFIIDKGVVKWGGGTYEEHNTNIANAEVIFNGIFKINGEATLDATSYIQTFDKRINSFSAGVHNAIEIEEANNYKYYVSPKASEQADTELEFISGINYEARMRFIGYSGELTNGGIYLVSSNPTIETYTVIENVQMLPIPAGLQSARGQMEGLVINYDNYVMWNKVPNATDYLVKSYRYVDATEQEYVPFETYLVSEQLGWSVENANNVFFTIDNLISQMGETDYETKAILLSIVAIGGSWREGVGSKFLTSLESNPEDFIIEFPETPTNLTYDGCGKITWDNETTGTVYLEIEYEYNSNAYGEYVNIENYTNNYVSEVVGRTQGENNRIIDRIIVFGQNASEDGEYKIKYLTNRINSISACTLSDFGYYSEEVKNQYSNSAKFDLFNGGDGSESLPYKIQTFSQLQNIGYYLDSNFKLTNNIRSSSYSSLWSPIGAARKEGFSGKIDGDNNGVNYTITLILNVFDGNNDNFDHAGFMYDVNAGGEISNIDFIFNNKVINDNHDTRINASGYHTLYIGGVVANDNRGNIHNVKTSGNINVVPTGNFPVIVGGIVGSNYGEISNCISETIIMCDANIYSSNYECNIGGISYSNYGEIIRCGVESTLTGTSVGGISQNNANLISECYFNGTILSNGNANYVFIGGIVGEAKSITINSVTIHSIVEYCYAIINEVTISSSSGFRYCGGLVGTNNENNCEIKNSYSELKKHTPNNAINKIYVGTVTGSQVSGANMGTCSNVYYNTQYTSRVHGLQDVTSATGCTGISILNNTVINALGNTKFAFINGTIELLWQN